MRGANTQAAIGYRQWIPGVREPRVISASLQVRARDSYDQWPFKIDCLEIAELFDVEIDWLGQPIETQAIFILVNDSQKLALQLLDLHLIDTAFKHRFLHTLTDTFTGFRDAPKSPPAFTSFCGYVIADNDEHGQRARKGR